MSLTPSQNTVASLALGVPIATIAAWGINLCCQVPMPAEVQSAFGAVITVVIGYIAEVRERRKAAAAAVPPSP